MYSQRKCHHQFQCWQQFQATHTQNVDLNNHNILKNKVAWTQVKQTVLKATCASASTFKCGHTFSLCLFNRINLNQDLVAQQEIAW